MIQTISNNQLNLLNGNLTVSNGKSKTNQTASFDSYLQAASSNATAAPAVSGTDNYVISPEDKEKYCGICVWPDAGKKIYYPPDNAPGSVKKAWVETMKSFKNDDERNQAKFPIHLAMSANSSGDYLNYEEAQSYLSSSLSSMSSLQDVYRRSIENNQRALGDPSMSKASIEATKKSIELDKKVLASLMKYDN